ncbi:MAG: PIG-L family deacetylase, partial [Bacteroidota bacterium]
DDPETGCGGLMALLAEEGHEVISCYLTRGEAGIPNISASDAAEIRTKEAITACEILGVAPYFLGQIDGGTEINNQWYQKVGDYLQEMQPDIVFTHWPIDTHRDHRVCSMLIYDAWLRTGQEAALYYYEVVSGGQTQNFSPTHYLDISSVREKKHQSCFAHISQKIEEMYFNDHGKMEEFRGMEYGCTYAEAFVAHHQNSRAYFI